MGTNPIHDGLRESQVRWNREEKLPAVHLISVVVRFADVRQDPWYDAYETKTLCPLKARFQDSGFGHDSCKHHVLMREELQALLKTRLRPGSPLSYVSHRMITGSHPLQALLIQTGSLGRTSLSVLEFGGGIFLTPISGWGRGHGSRIVPTEQAS